MAYDFNGTNAYIDFRTASPTLGPSYSIGCWFNADVNNAAQGLVSLQNQSAGRNAHLAIDANGAVAARPRSSQTGDAATSTTISTGTWNHGLATFTVNGAGTGTASRTAYLNGGGSGTSSAEVTLMDGLSILNIGSRMTGSASRSEYFNGRIAEVAVWSAALTADDALALATGVSPRLVRPDKLWFYAPLIRDRVDLRQGIASTTGGSPTVDIHPRRIG